MTYAIIDPKTRMKKYREQSQSNFPSLTTSQGTVQHNCYTVYYRIFHDELFLLECSDSFYSEGSHNAGKEG